MQVDCERDLEKLLLLCSTEVHADIKDTDISAYKWEEKDGCVFIRFNSFRQRFSLYGSDPDELCRLFALGTELAGDFVKVVHGIKFLQSVESLEKRTFSFHSENAGRVIRLIEKLNLPCVAVTKEENAVLFGRFQRVIFIGNAYEIPEGKDTRILLFAKDEEEAERLSNKFCDCYLAKVI